MNPCSNVRAFSVPSSDTPQHKLSYQVRACREKEFKMTVQPHADMQRAIRLIVLLYQGKADDGNRIASKSIRLTEPLSDHPKPANEGHLKTGQR